MKTTDLEWQKSGFILKLDDRQSGMDPIHKDTDGI